MNGKIAGLDVSRETLAALGAYEALLLKWNQRINLVAPSTVECLQQRHIIDSAQLFSLCPPDALHWADLGSGGGLPGVVCAILAQQLAPRMEFTLVESDKRKAAFLTVCKQKFALKLTVRSERAEAVEPLIADIISARALAPLPHLLPLVSRHLSETGLALLPKGKSYATELEAARHEWQFDVEVHSSQTDDFARILTLKDIRRV